MPNKFFFLDEKGQQVLAVVKTDIERLVKKFDDIQAVMARPGRSRC
jgi:hypothetical protein